MSSDKTPIWFGCSISNQVFWCIEVVVADTDDAHRMSSADMVEELFSRWNDLFDIYTFNDIQRLVKAFRDEGYFGPQGVFS